MSVWAALRGAWGAYTFIRSRVMNAQIADVIRQSDDPVLSIEFTSTGFHVRNVGQGTPTQVSYRIALVGSNGDAVTNVLEGVLGDALARHSGGVSIVLAAAQLSALRVATEQDLNLDLCVIADYETPHGRKSYQRACPDNWPPGDQ